MVIIQSTIPFSHSDVEQFYPRSPGTNPGFCHRGPPKRRARRFLNNLINSSKSPLKGPKISKSVSGHGGEVVDGCVVEELVDGWVEDPVVGWLEELVLLEGVVD